MNLELIKSIQISLLHKESEINSENKAAYSKKITAKFTFPLDFPRTEEAFSILLTEMYHDLQKHAPDDVDSIAIWIEYDNVIIENAVFIRTLDDIKEYAKEEMNPIFEFFKMTIQNNTPAEFHDN